MPGENKLGDRRASPIFPLMPTRGGDSSAKKKLTRWTIKQGMAGSLHSKAGGFDAILIDEDADSGQGICGFPEVGFLPTGSQTRWNGKNYGHRRPAGNRALEGIHFVKAGATARTIGMHKKKERRLSHRQMQPRMGGKVPLNRSAGDRGKLLLLEGNKTDEHSHDPDNSPKQEQEGKPAMKRRCRHS